MRFSIYLRLITFICFFISGEAHAKAELHQIISGDSDSYQPFNRSFFVSQEPIIKLATHSSLCELSRENEDHRAIKQSHEIWARNSKHVHIGTYALCAQSEGAAVSDDLTKIYLFARNDSMRSFEEVMSLLQDNGTKLSKDEIATLVQYLGYTDSIADFHDFRITDSLSPLLSFSTVSNNDVSYKQTLISAKFTDEGIFIYERIKNDSTPQPWTFLDIRSQIKALELLQLGTGLKSSDSSALDKQPDAEQGYFLENVAFALKLEFDVNNFGFPILRRLMKNQTTVGVSVMDHSALRRENDWLYFIEAFFIATKTNDEKLNLATNMPKTILKVKGKFSCTKRVVIPIAESYSMLGQKNNWDNMTSNFSYGENTDHLFLLCAQGLSLQDPQKVLEAYDSIYSSTYFYQPNYARSAVRLMYEYNAYMMSK